MTGNARCNHSAFRKFRTGIVVIALQVKQNHNPFIKNNLTIKLKLKSNNNNNNVYTPKNLCCRQYGFMIPALKFLSLLDKPREPRLVISPAV
jgi:hypothetical protein